MQAGATAGHVSCGAARRRWRSPAFRPAISPLPRAPRASAGWILQALASVLSAANATRPLQIRVDHQPETVDFPIVTLDEPDLLAPKFHISREAGSRGSTPATPCPVTRSSALRPAVSKVGHRPISRRSQAAVDEDALRFDSSHCWIWLRGAAPTFWATGCPSLNSSIVGIPRTP